jgi:hypothetical protein
MSESIRIDTRGQLRELAARLGVRKDWHEPDEQKLTAVAHGDDFDNCGFWGHWKGELNTFGEGRQEMWIELRQDGQPVAEINLATLLAWAAEQDGAAGLEQAATEAAGDTTWSAVRAHLRAAVLYELPRYGGHERGGSVADGEAWRRASPDELAECIVTYAMAGIAPVLMREQVASGVAMIRDLLARSGVDLASLTWHGTERP